LIIKILASILSLAFKHLPAGIQSTQKTEESPPEGTQNFKNFRYKALVWKTLMLKIKESTFSTGSDFQQI